MFDFWKRPQRVGEIERTVVRKAEKIEKPKVLRTLVVIVLRANELFRWLIGIEPWQTLRRLWVDRRWRIGNRRIRIPTQSRNDRRRKRKITTVRTRYRRTIRSGFRTNRDLSIAVYETWRRYVGR